MRKRLKVLLVIIPILLTILIIYIYIWKTENIMYVLQVWDL